MQYKVVFGGPGKEIINLVNDMIKDGWIPQGGISVIQDSALGPILFQAMVKKKEDKEENVPQKKNREEA